MSQSLHSLCHVVSSELPHLGISSDLAPAHISVYIFFFFYFPLRGRQGCLLYAPVFNLTSQSFMLVSFAPPRTMFSISNHLNIYFHAIPSLCNSFSLKPAEQSLPLMLRLAWVTSWAHWCSSVIWRQWSGPTIPCSPSRPWTQHQSSLHKKENNCLHRCFLLPHFYGLNGAESSQGSIYLTCTPKRTS